MIPVELTIQGLYSYQQKQFIDFTQLTAAHLFGIFGSVGSGKSTVLEAITFALYGRTDRLNLSGDKRNYNMMNLKSNELLIAFVFETGKSQTRYLAEVKGRRNSKRFEDVKTLDRTAYRMEKGKWIPIEPLELEAAIGLSYENFKRTIIIPQGQFQEFLQLKNKDRTQMMKELFHLEKFELYHKAAALEQKNNALLQHTEGQLQQLGTIDPEQLKVYEQQLEQLKKESDQIKAQLERLKTEEIQWQQLSGLNTKLNKVQGELKELSSKQEEMARLEEKISRYEDCLLQFKNLIEAADNSRQQLALQKSNIENESRKKQELSTLLKVEEERFTKIKKDYEQREQLLQQAEEIQKIERILNLEKQLHTDRERLHKGEKIQQATQQKIDHLQKEKNTLHQAIKQIKAQQPDMALLTRVQSWHLANKNLLRQSEELNSDAQTHRQQSIRLEDAMKQMADSLQTDSSLAGDAPALLQLLKDKIDQIKSKMKANNEAANQLRLQQELENYAQALNEGDPCPLCGARHHPEPFSAESVKTKLNELIKTNENHEKEVENLGEMMVKAGELKHQLSVEQKQLELIRRKEQNIVEQRKEHDKAFQWKAYASEQDVTKALQLAELLQKQLKAQESQYEKVSSDLDESIKNKELYQQKIDELKTSQTSYSSEINILKQQIKRLAPDDFREKTNSEISLLRSRLIEQHSHIEKEYSNQAEKLTLLRKQYDQISGSIEANLKAFMAEEVRTQKLHEQLETELEKSSYRQLAEVKTILAEQIDLPKAKKELTAFQNALAAAKKQEQQLNEELAGRSYNEQKHNELKKEIATLDESLNQKNKTMGKTDALLKQLGEDLEQLAKLTKQHEALLERAENIRRMKTLFKGSGFVNYISSVYLQNLCNAANDRFYQLTRQKLSLEITDDNSFEVRDFMNGGKVRNIKTLSGGQTFQAALSLALALADNIQKITESNQNFFFLDEGFGSLDKEALTVVFDTLKALRRENRIVGVISHVEEMQQEIDVHLKVENSEANGSIIRPSWKN
ncbi:AAA family ATPase [Roseimarinus sediminis]|uniref:AAA family ATPase n=1 Tax=Roseimarinus sediminis TaxID=1610899 RepID=UPI003D19808D